MREREEVERIERGGFTARIFYDEDPMSPKDWDQLGTLVTWHRRYCWDEDGEKTFGKPSDFRERAEADGWIYLPVSMYEHSGVTIWVGSGTAACDSAGWDSGQVGYIYTTEARYREICEDGDGADKKLKSGWQDRAKECLESEVKTWDQYIRGDVYGYVITGPDGEHYDSCWGFYGFKEAKKEATGQLDATIEWEKEEDKKIQRMLAL